MIDEVAGDLVALDALTEEAICEAVGECVIADEGALSGRVVEATGWADKAAVVGLDSGAIGGLVTNLGVAVDVGKLVALSSSEEPE